MATTNSTTAADLTANNSNEVSNPLAPKAPIAQTSAKAQRILGKGKAKAAEAKGSKGKKAEKKADKKAEKKAPKEPKVTFASKLDEIILTGGKWDALVTKANEEGKKLGSKITCNVGYLKAHIRFRTVAQGKKDFLGKKKVTDIGVVNATNKKEKVA